jgi:hypothetical protein
MVLPWFLLKEDGGKLLLETDDKIILDNLYFIAGVATLLGSPLENAKITLIDSDTDTVVDTVLTDATGYYIFENLNSAKTYHVVAEFDDNPDYYNAKSLPFLTPVR